MTNTIAYHDTKLIAVIKRLMKNALAPGVNVLKLFFVADYEHSKLEC